MMDDTKILPYAMAIARRAAAHIMAEMAKSDVDGAQLIGRLQAAIGAGNASLELRIDLESCTASLYMHHVELGIVNLGNLVPEPEVPAA